MSRKYKDYRFYAFITLNYIFQTLDLSLSQSDLMEKARPLIEAQQGVNKSEIMHEIKSNHNMTNKVLDYLQGEGLVELHHEGGYRVLITLKGIKYLKEYSSFYRTLFSMELSDHYKYGTKPSWAR